MRALIAQGYLGGPPVHMESYYGYDISDGYARALLTDPRHWVRRLPGGLLQNVISHGIARLAEFLESQAKLKGKVGSALVYPAFMFLSTIGIMLVLSVSGGIGFLPLAVSAIWSTIQTIAAFALVPIACRSLHKPPALSL